MHIMNLLFCFRMGFSSLHYKYATPVLRTGFYSRLDNTIRGAPITVRGVVDVDVACRVDIPCVVRVTAIRRTQTAVLRLQPTPNIITHIWADTFFCLCPAILGLTLLYGWLCQTNI